MLTSWLLSLLIWFPIIGGIIVLLIGRSDRNKRTARLVALLFALVTLALCIPLYQGFDPSSYQMQFVENIPWIQQLGIRYALGVDGISVLFVILSSFTNVVIVLAAWRSIKFKQAQYMAIFLISTGIMNGAFCALDAILFYVFFEAAMVPMYLGIGIWGGKKRVHAAFKFFIYTFLGSVFLLIAILYLGHVSGQYNIASFENLILTPGVDDLLFLAFLLAFAVKIPMWPVHTWLPDAHTQAPPGGSVVLAALMLKMGAYGLIRFTFPIVPGVSQQMDWIMIALSLIAIVYVGLATIAQKDMKRLIAYSSISHMGIVTLGLFMVYMIVGQTHDYNDAMVSVQGAVFQMIAHAFATGGLFIGVGFLHERFGTYMIDDLSGIAKAMPIFAVFMMIFSLSNVGLPGTAGFVGEFLVVISSLKAHLWIAIVAGLTLIIAPGYTLWFYKRVLFGKVKNTMVLNGQGLTQLEILIFVVLAIPVILFGLYPQPILHLSQATTSNFVNHIMQVIHQGAYI